MALLLRWSSYPQYLRPLNPAKIAQLISDVFVGIRSWRVKFPNGKIDDYFLSQICNLLVIMSEQDTLNVALILLWVSIATLLLTLIIILFFW